MTVKKFKCVVERRDEYIIEIDDKVINKEWVDNFRLYMYQFHNLHEHAEHLAQIQARFGDSLRFIEGYGSVKRDGEYLCGTQKDELLCEGVNIIIVEEDEDCEVQVTEIKEEVKK